MYDLHTHTSRSDGQHTPEELVLLAAQRNLQGLGITDHDEIGGIERALAQAARTGLEIIPGVELSTSHRGYDVHILGYFIDYRDRGLLHFLHTLQEQRRRRASRIVEKLNRLGVAMSFEAVLQEAGEGCIGRPHVANALVREGYVTTFQDAFNHYLAEDKPAFVPKPELAPAAGIAIIHQAGGLAGLAHPGQNLTTEIVLEIIKIGVDAIETIHPKHSSERQRFFQELAEKFGLLQTGGSDFHGGARGLEKLGHYSVSREQVDRLRALVEERRKIWQP
ncbi:MAG: PHP domain-containing protein [candidate division KSB1 bacterium]|nr:PHP domain-containing protein [candidate division KSB1 bacterium]MDZ7275349.1 PHP domain-containing protein [candidate division KSB1 bacterium]MDZ7287516.1 PHP domain-containing protein [candidate division KSB1 bacterium]MDZ7299630.1 PHP domain-containing protein [candidate division KSB1 bacterium]MDZ7307423.1 PHP domain-containing protein [candidate division KSB1 bacterium]